MAPSSSPLRTTSETDEKYANVKWEELGFALTPIDYMYVAKCRQGESFTQGKIVPYGDIQLALVLRFSITARDYLKVSKLTEQKTTGLGFSGLTKTLFACKLVRRGFV